MQKFSFDFMKPRNDFCELYKAWKESEREMMMMSCKFFNVLHQQIKKLFMLLHFNPDDAMFWYNFQHTHTRQKKVPWYLFSMGPKALPSHFRKSAWRLTHLKLIRSNLCVLLNYSSGRRKSYTQQHWQLSIVLFRNILLYLKA